MRCVRNYTCAPRFESAMMESLGRVAHLLLGDVTRTLFRLPRRARRVCNRPGENYFHWSSISLDCAVFAFSAFPVCQFAFHWNLNQRRTNKNVIFWRAHQTGKHSFDSRNEITGRKQTLFARADNVASFPWKSACERNLVTYNDVLFK